VIRWMAENRVAANLLMILILAGGIYNALTIKQEVFPEFTLDFVSVSYSYPGATPDDLEESVVLPAESAIRSINGIKRFTSKINEGSASLNVELLDGNDPQKIRDEIEQALNRISTLPEEVEAPRVVTATIRQEVLNVAVYGDAPQRSLLEIAQTLQDELLNHPDISQVEVESVQQYEITVLLSQHRLQQLGLTLSEVASRIRSATLDLPGGRIQTSGGDLLIRTKERRYTVEDYARIPLFTTPSGTVTLGDVAEIQDGFEESDQRNRFNGQNSEFINVNRTGDETPTAVSNAVHEVLEQLRPRLPRSVQVDVLADRSVILQDRIDLLTRNMWVGLILVFLVLALFLETGLSFWIMLGIPISFAGAFLTMPQLEVSINMLSLFAFITVLGIVVDDAIVVGENIQAHREMGKTGLKAAVDGTLEIASPVVITILTTVAAFVAFYFIGGTTGKFFQQIPDVVIAVLVFSLIEGLFILPAHLSHRANLLIRAVLWPIEALLHTPRRFFSSGLRWVVEQPYRKTLQLALRYRYATLALALVSVMLSAGLMVGGHLRFTFFPRIDSDFISVTARMPFGTPVDVTAQVEERLVREAQALLAEYEQQQGLPVSTGLYSSVGRGGSHIARVRVFLEPLNIRGFAAQEFSRKWEARVGEVPGLESINFRASTGFGAGSDLELRLSHPDARMLDWAIERTKEELRNFSGVRNIEDNSDSGKREVRLKVSEAGAALGFTAQGLTQQVRGAFQGLEALSFIRGGEEVNVTLRLPLEERRYLPNLSGLVVQAPNGARALLGEVAVLEFGRAFSSINREEGSRVLSVVADVDSSVSNTNEITKALDRDFVPQLKQDFPGLSVAYGGSRRDQSETFAGVRTGGLFALIMIYSLLALQFRNYFQPLVIMSAIPFGLVGAVIGHLIMGYELSIVSVLGIVALTGVVVNDSLILVDFVNQNRREGLHPFEAAIEAGVRRFRPILLTTLTTFFGLLPMIFEQSLQARFIVPMAISLAFGVLFSTFIILILIPVLYLILEDFGRLLRRPTPPETASKTQWA
jgi:multidrug efflux pump subunit AcrB